MIKRPKMRSIEERLKFDGFEDLAPVLFYRADDEWGCFSNFSVHEIWLPNPFTEEIVYYKTGEHRFQAMKATDMDDHEFVRHQSTAYKSKEAGRAISLRGGWGNDYGDLCWYVMVETVLAKAQQNRFVLDELMLTYDYGANTREGLPIYEDSPTDDIWGVRHRNDYRGKNLLGRAWMQVRDVLQP